MGFGVSQGGELGGVNEDGASGERRKLVGSLGGGKGDLWLTELDFVSQLGVGTEWIGWRDGDTEVKKREIKNGDVERRWAEDKSNVIIV